MALVIKYLLTQDRKSSLVLTSALSIHLTGRCSRGSAALPLDIFE